MAGAKTQPGPCIDGNAMRIALKAILEPGQVTEVRALGVSNGAYRKPHVVSGYFTDLEKLVDETARIASCARGVYFIPNPINPALLARAVNRLRPAQDKEPLTADVDVTCRRWFLVDCDALRPSGIGASDAEHQNALTCAHSIAEWLASRGWPAPILADSGNGGHLLYRVELPSNDEGLIQRCLGALAFFFDGESVVVDRSVFNPARIWKLYGTYARKGDNAAERPHRLSSVIRIPESPQVVSAELLHGLAELGPKEHEQEGSGRQTRHRPLGLHEWIARNLPDAHGPFEWKGGRRWIIDVCPWNANHRNRSAYIVELPNGAIAAGCHHSSCAGNHWASLREFFDSKDPRHQRDSRPDPSGPATDGPLVAGDLVPAAASALSEEWVPRGFRVKTDGVYAASDEGEFRICSRLEVLALARGFEGENWGRLIRVIDRDGVVHDWVMPMEMMASDGTEIRARLLNMGLEIEPTARARQYLSRFIQLAHPTTKVRSVDRLGWHDGVFVFPDQSFGDSVGERVIFQLGRDWPHKLKVSGTLEDWTSNIGRLCAGNSRLVFAVSCAFAGPLLPILQEPGGGFHLRGPSSCGKTTCLLAAGSVWGGGTGNGYIDSWKATGNGLEALAASHTHGLLCLDELGQADPKEVSETTYALANGTGKSRMNRLIQARKSLEWLLIYLSSGEVSLAEQIKLAGTRIHAGQEVRFCDIEADAGRGLGAFEQLHGANSPAEFAKRIADAATRHYGSPIRTFLQALTVRKDDLFQDARQTKSTFLKRNVPPGASGEVIRAAARFGTAAAGGELASALGITGWRTGEALAAAEACFRCWLRSRGTAGALDEISAIRQVRGFLQCHGNSRFQILSRDKNRQLTERVPNRAGFMTEVEGEIVYLIFSEPFRDEVCRGFDYQAVARVLHRRGFLLVQEGSRRLQYLKRIPGSAKDRIRLYAVKASILADEENCQIGSGDTGDIGDIDCKQLTNDNQSAVEASSGTTK